MTKSQTMQALARIGAGEKVAAVARDLGISTAAVYAALRRREGKEICPCCAQVVRKGFEAATVPAETLEYLQRIATEQNQSLSWVVAYALKAWVKLVQEKQG